jgi:hypothetical protein
VPGAAEPTSCGSISAVTSIGGSPVARIISRSMLLRNCRTLPGQSCVCRIAMASSAIGVSAIRCREI